MGRVEAETEPQVGKMGQEGGEDGHVREAGRLKRGVIETQGGGQQCSQEALDDLGRMCPPQQAETTLPSS